MKKCRLSYDEWKCILAKKQKIEFVNSEMINGYVSLLTINDVSTPQIWKFNGQDTVVCQKGYEWITILPSNEYYCIMSMLNDEKEILLWYIDMIYDQGVDKDGMPYFEDLYLDLVVYPNGEIIVDDMDELEDAWNKGNITEEQFELAIKTCENLKDGLLSNITLMKEFTYKCMSLMQE